VSRALTLSSVFILVTLVSGCSTSRPMLSAPGPIRQQQSRASVHDPYADNVAGPPIVGGRPREFQEPLAEPVRSRPYQETWRTR
jgi:hypothetical protein